MSSPPARRVLTVLAACLVAAGCESSSSPAPTPVPGAPSLSCPASISVAGVQSGSLQIVYPKPVLTGGAAPIQSSCVPRQGTTFPIGTTVVTCSTTDSLGRQTSCTFGVTLTRRVLAVQRFLAFGDSVTVGEDGRAASLEPSIVNPATSYPTRLREMLDADFPGQGLSVVNAGKSGEPVACVPPPADTCGVMRLPIELALHRPQALLLLHGYNDLNNGSAAVNLVVAALRESIRIARATGVQYVFVSTITPGREATGPFDRERDPGVILDTNAAIAAMVPSEGAYLVDAYAAFAGRELELIDQDGLHLNAAGNRVLAETFYARIRQVVPSPEQLTAGGAS